MGMARAYRIPTASRSVLPESQRVVLAGVFNATKPHIRATSNGKGHWYFELKGVTSQPIADLPVLDGDADRFGDPVSPEVAEHARVTIYRTR